MELLFYIFVGSVIVRLCYAVCYYLRLATYRVKSNVQPNSEPVSIIVCYHNEADQVSQSTKALAYQSIEHRELLLVNDGSTDDTLDLLRTNTLNATIVDVTKSSLGKKQALASGINGAQHEWLLMTDADCTMTSEWAKSMMSHTMDNKIVLGYAPLNRSKTLTGKFARYETYYTALQYLSFALAGRPYMGVGRNLLYHRSIYDSAEGFESHKDLASGDDDLLINMAANSENTTICLDSDSFVYSEGKQTLRSFIRQKSRHITSSFQYRLVDKLLLGLSAMVHIMMYVSAVMLILFGAPAILGMILAFWIFMMILQYPICHKLHSRDLWIWYPLYDIMMSVYYIVMIPFTFIKKQNTWN